MLSARSPLSVNNEKTLSSEMNKMALDKENTVRAEIKMTNCHFNVSTEIKC